MTDSESSIHAFQGTMQHFASSLWWYTLRVLLTSDCRLPTADCTETFTPPLAFA